MINIFLTESTTSLMFKDGKLVVLKDGETTEFPIKTVNEVHVSGLAEISSRDICKLAANGIGVTFSHGFDVVCKTNCENLERQRNQFVMNEDEGYRLALSKKLIGAKINNQSQFLYEVCGIKEEVATLEKAESRNELLGIEGSFARRYFQHFGRLVPEAAGFTSRKKHPATDPVNSVLSYVYSIIYRKYTMMIIKHGLNPCVGFMHDLKAGHYALASDLMEPFRSVLGDRVVYEVFKEGYDENDFDSRSDGGVLISGDLRDRIIEVFDDVCDRPVRTQNGFSNTMEGKMEEQLCSYVKAVDKRDETLFVPYMKGCA